MKPRSKSVWISPAACGRLRAHLDRPGTGLLGPDGEEGDEVQQVVAGADDAGEAGLVQAQLLEKGEPLVHVHGDEVGLDGGGDDHRLGAFGMRLVEDAGGISVALTRILFIDVADVEHGLGGQQLRHREMARFLLVLGLVRRAGLPSRSSSSAWPRTAPAISILVAGLAALDEVGDALLQAFEVGKEQLGLDGFRIGNWVDPVLDMLDVVVLEAAQDMDDGVHFADVGEELVAEAFALRRALHQAGDVDEGQLGRDDLGRAGDGGEFVEARIGTATSPTLGSMVQNG